MSPTPRELAESYWLAEERHDVEQVLAHYHPDATFHPMAGPLVGHAEIRTFYEAMGDSYPGLEVRIVHEVSSGEEAAIEWEADLIDHDGVRTAICGANFFRLRDDKFSYVRAYFDPASFSQPGGST